MKYIVIGGVILGIAYLAFGAVIFGQIAAAAGGTGSPLHDPAQPTTIGRINLSSSPFSSRVRPNAV
jgi:hypothetical protein